MGFKTRHGTTVHSRAHFAWLLCGVLGALAVWSNDANAHPSSRSFVYVDANPSGPNGIEAFSRDSRTGFLTRIGRFSSGGLGFAFVGGLEQHALVVKGRHLYAVNPGDDTIASFTINPDGSLELLGTVPSGGFRPSAITVSGKFAYVANKGGFPGEPVAAPSYSGFRVLDDGRLQPIPQSTVTLDPGDFPADILFAQDGDVLIGTRLFGDKIDSFRVNERTGLLSDAHVTIGGGGPFGVMTLNSEPSLLVTLGNPPGPKSPGVSLFAINGHAKLREIDTFVDPDKSDAGLRDPCWTAPAPDGRHVWVSSYIPRMITAFSLAGDRVRRVSEYNPHDFEEVPNPLDPTGPKVKATVGGTDIEVSSDGRFLYQLRPASEPDGSLPVIPRIDVLRVTNDYRRNGGLQKVQSVFMPDDLIFSGATGIVVADLD